MRVPSAIGLLALVGSVVDAMGGGPDLQCYKVTNENLKALRAVVDLETPRVGVAAGCKLSKPKLFCAPTGATLAPGTLFDGKQPGTEFDIEVTATDSARVCYGLKCKKGVGTGTAQNVTARFGAHQFAKLKTSMLCTPVSKINVTATGFTVRSDDFELPGNTQLTHCVFFRAVNSTPLMIKKWTSRMPPQAQQMIVVLTDGDIQPPGAEGNCDLLDAHNMDGTLQWVHIADQPETSFEFPSDDGTGKPLGLPIAPAQAGVMWIHYLNVGGPITTHVELEAVAYPAGQNVTAANTFATFNGNISIPPQSSDSETFTCSVPDGAKFLTLTTQSFKQSVHTYIKDDTAVVFESTDFAHPGTLRFDPPASFAFASAKLTYQCDYMNPSNRTIQTGSNPFTDELCMAIGLIFPSDRPRVCYNTFLVP